jgi:hypothetical protein
MPLPSSGQISIKQIFDEATGGGCYEGGSGYSLGALADALGIGTNPDAMSEFYGLSCPFTSTIIYFFTFFDGNIPEGFSSNSDACLYYDLYESATVYYSGTLGSGTQLWEDSGGTISFNNNGGWFYIGGFVFQLDGNAIFDYTSC